MGRLSLKERIREGLFLLDGAMGTQLIARGTKVGVCNDYMNIESGDIVFDVHREYIEAGSDALLTNTFGANKYALARHGFAEEVAVINTAGAELAKRSAGEQKYVLGDIGPSGDFLVPLGGIKPDELEDAFTEQVKGLLAGGVDGFIIETMTALDEIEIAIEAVQSVGGGMPLFASMSFDRAGGDYRTMMGIDVEAAVSKIVSLGVDAVGFNCGTLELDEYVELAEKFVSVVSALNQHVFVLAEPNAGRPELVGDKAVYKVSPEDFAAAAERIHSAGVTVIGGCCGTGPEHIEAVAKKMAR